MRVRGRLSRGAGSGRLTRAYAGTLLNPVFADDPEPENWIRPFYEYSHSETGTNSAVRARSSSHFCACPSL
jgi:hypothetical protein